MRKTEAYELNLNLDSKIIQFTFVSVGNKGMIQKVIEFRRLQNNRWNLSFGDVKGDDWADNVVSDNGDLRKVLQTIANAIHLFFDHYPEDEIFIAPLDKQRKLLYNRIFQQNWQEIEPVFTVKSIVLMENNIFVEDYTPAKIADYFVVRRKTPNFEY